MVHKGTLPTFLQIPQGPGRTRKGTQIQQPDHPYPKVKISCLPSPFTTRSLKLEVPRRCQGATRETEAEEHGRLSVIRSELNTGTYGI